MKGVPSEFTYNYEMISKLSGWSEDNVRQAQSRGDARLANLGEAAIWLSAHAKPRIRAEMARRLLPAVLGIDLRLRDRSALAKQIDSLDLLLEIFERDERARRARGKKISKSKGTNGANSK